MVKTSFLVTTLMTLAPLGASAQIVNMPMEPSASNTLEETVTGAKLTVSTALTPYTVPGAKGQAWRLDGYSSCAHGNADLSALEGKSQLTFSLWVAPESYPMMRIEGNGEWFTTMAGSMRLDDNNQRDNTFGKGFSFQLGSRGSYMFTCYCMGVELTVKATEKLKRYEWNHLVAVFDGTKKKVTLYNNGSEVGWKRCGTTFTSASNELFIGKSAAEVKSGMCCLNTFNGLIDDFAVYDGVRNDIVADVAENDAVLTYAPERYAADICRPTFHGMPTANWTNETHGAVYHNGKFHLFFQKNPNGLYLSHMHWGHLVSDNLYKWEEMPTAISPGDDVSWYDQKGCWSGCVFTDDELTGGVPNIFYTGVDFARAMISQAIPADDDLQVWNKAEANPVIDGRPNGLSDDFRDCFVFKHNGNYYMIVGSSKDGVGVATLHRYDKSSRKWSNDGSLFFKGQTATRDGSFWEMPNVTQFGNKWLFTCTPLSTSKGVRTLYWVGTIGADGTFKADSPAPKTVELDGFSKEGYGMLSPTIFTHDGKTLMLGVVPDKLGDADHYRLGYAHAYSLPREIWLDADGTLMQQPYSGLAAMRSGKSYKRMDFTLNGSQDLSPVVGRALELDGTFTVGSNDFGFTVFDNGDKKATITYSPSQNKVSVDLRNCDRMVQDATFGGLYEAQLPQRVAVGQTARLRVYVDHSFIDVFVNDRYAASVRIFPTDVSGVKATAFALGSVEVKSLGAYVLDASQTTGVGAVEADGFLVKGCRGGVAYDTGIRTADIVVYSTSGVCRHSFRKVCGSGVVGVSERGVSIVRVTDSETGASQVFKVVVTS